MTDDELELDLENEADGEEVEDVEEMPRLPRELPVLPLRELVVFPMAVAPVAVGQERSVQLIDDVMKGDRLVALVAQSNQHARPAGPEDIHRVGTAAIIHQHMRAPDGTIRLIVQGLERISLTEFVQTEPYLVARILPVPDTMGDRMETEALVRSARELFQQVVAFVPWLPDELGIAVQNVSDPRQLAYMIASAVPMELTARQDILELGTTTEKLRRLVGILQHEIALRELERKIASETQETLSKAQREFFLREHMKTIQKELGDEDKDEIAEMRRRMESLPLPEEARKEVERELSHLERLSPMAMEHGTARTYLEWILDLPWGKRSGGSFDIPHAAAVLDADHYDLDKVKERILEYLAVKKLRDERHATAPLTGAGEAGPAAEAGPVPATRKDEGRREPLLCFVGPPGVGKTSLGQSIARAMGRSFVRISLGGVHDEAEIRGHRRTYVGAMPGRIIQALRRTEAADPVFMLDEVDKLGAGFHGDPSAALLEVLDPAQNKAFVDTYLGVPFDLTQVLFICTANTTAHIPPALLDRMEVIELPGYTDDDKLHIARRHLIPGLLKGHALREDEVTIDDEAVGHVIRDYTREAGVRNLERSLAGILRKVACHVSEGKPTPVKVTADRLHAYLGPPKFFDELAERIDRPGVATGLAWTPTGGELLFIETAMMPARQERVTLTGMLGDVMRESAQAALSWLRSNARQFGIDPELFEGKAVHVHVPAGAIPKDGPSAGVTIAVSLASLALGKVVRNDLAMTGEITLRGKVLPVGGIKEKALAAHRSGVRTMVLPRRNESAIEDIPAEVRGEMEFVFVDSVSEALMAALAPGEEAEARPSEQPPAPQVH